MNRAVRLVVNSNLSTGVSERVNVSMGRCDGLETCPGGYPAPPTVTAGYWPERKKHEGGLGQRATSGEIPHKHKDNMQTPDR